MWEDIILVNIPGQFHHTPKDVTCLISIYNYFNIILKQSQLKFNWFQQLAHR